MAGTSVWTDLAGAGVVPAPVGIRHGLTRAGWLAALSRGWFCGFSRCFPCRRLRACLGVFLSSRGRLP